MQLLSSSFATDNGSETSPDVAHTFSTDDSDVVLYIDFVDEIRQCDHSCQRNAIYQFFGFHDFGVFRLRMNRIRALLSMRYMLLVYSFEPRP